MADATEKDYPVQFVSHRWVENAGVAKKARMVWEKMVIITNYWCQLPKSKQPGLGKPGNNTSFDYLRKAVKDPLIPIKVLFFEEVARKLGEFLVIFQTDQPMAAFLVETLHDLLLSFMEKFVPKSILEKNSSCLSLMKIVLNAVNNRKPVDRIDLGFAVTHEIQLLRKRNKSVTDIMILHLKKEAVTYM